MPRSDHMLKRLRRVERHIRFVLVLAQPRRQIGVAVFAVFIEDDD